jgi:nicotinamidase-related amidase
MASARTALILLDCQKSFISGQWMAAVNVSEVEPIRSAFDKIAAFLPSLSDNVRILATQCPFSRVSDFDLYPPVNDALSGRDAVKRVIKPGNSVLDASGAIHWLDSAIFDAGVRRVVVVGCTLTSCVRVSALDVHRRYAANVAEFQTCVDLNLCGARASNYVGRCADCLRAYLQGYCPGVCTHDSSHGALQSPVDKTVDDLRAAGVNVFDSFDWSSCTI